MATYTIEEEDKIEAKRLARKKYCAEYYQQNKEQIKARTKAYYWSNRDWYVKYFANYYQENKGEYCRRAKLYYLKNESKNKA